MLLQPCLSGMSVNEYILSTLSKGTKTRHPVGSSFSALERNLGVSQTLPDDFQAILLLASKLVLWQI